jgi:hypothetical protein
LVSAKIDMKNITVKGSKGREKLTVSNCFRIILFKLSVPLNRTIGIIIKVIEISYDNICDTERKDPKNAYLELLDQPAIKIPYTPKEEVIIIKNTLRFRFNIPENESNGITDQPIKLRKRVKAGPKINKKLLVFVGMIISLTTNFKPSEIGCNKPQGPTKFGPFLLWIDAIAFLSAKVKKATTNNKGINVKNIYIMKSRGL